MYPSTGLPETAVWILSISLIYRAVFMRLWNKFASAYSGASRSLYPLMSIDFCLFISGFLLIF